MRLNFGREGFIFFSFYRFQKIYPDNTIIEFPVILNQHKRKQKKRFPVKLIRFGKPRDFLDYQKKCEHFFFLYTIKPTDSLWVSKKLWRSDNVKNLLYNSIAAWKLQN